VRGSGPGMGVTCVIDAGEEEGRRKGGERVGNRMRGQRNGAGGGEGGGGVRLRSGGNGDGWRWEEK